MSRVAKSPINIPENVEFSLSPARTWNLLGDIGVPAVVHSTYLDRK